MDVALIRKRWPSRRRPHRRASGLVQPCDAANGSGCHGPCFRRRLSTRHARAAPAVAELGVVRRLATLSPNELPYCPRLASGRSGVFAPASVCVLLFGLARIARLPRCRFPATLFRYRLSLILVMRLTCFISAHTLRIRRFIRLASDTFGLSSTQRSLFYLWPLSTPFPLATSFTTSRLSDGRS